VKGSIRAFAFGPKVVCRLNPEILNPEIEVIIGL
jgi:hypothetical protein